MLFLLFQLGTDRYALDAREVAEVLPLVALKQIPQASRGVAGLFNYRGTPVPAIDLNELMTQVPAAQRFNTRIVLVRYRGADGREHPLGLIAEHAKETVRRDVAEFVDYGVATPSAPYLGPVASDSSGLLQWVHIDKLLPPSLQELLFRGAIA
jgi:chemotaxis-related protein WspB